MTEKQAIKQMSQIEYQTRKLTESLTKLRENLDLDAGFSSEEYADAGRKVCEALDKLEDELLK
jgi:hypothetical protein